MSDYNYILEKAKKEYFLIDFLICPAVDNKIIYFKAGGFKHFTYKGGVPRPIPDIIRRLKLIKYIKRVLISNKTYEKEYRIIKNINYVAVKYIINNQYIKIVLCKTKNNTYNFVSVMNINKKSE